MKKKIQRQSAQRVKNTTDVGPNGNVQLEQLFTFLRCRLCLSTSLSSVGMFRFALCQIWYCSVPNGRVSVLFSVLWRHRHSCNVVDRNSSILFSFAKVVAIVIWQKITQQLRLRRHNARRTRRDALVQFEFDASAERNK